MGLVEDIVGWVKKRVKEAKAEGVVFGLSGGLDSSCVGVLCKKALDEKALGLILPCQSSPEDEDLALCLADKFNIKTERIVLDSLYDKYLEILPEGKKLAKANLKPRLRMVILYYYANNLNYLVVGSSNKSELNVGYFTKYGDSAVDLLPLGGLLKSEVRKLARDLGIPRKIITRAPTAGLWQGQTDEEELGLSYKDLDEAIIAIEEDKAKKFSNPKIINKVRKMMGDSGHKRKTPSIYKK